MRSYLDIELKALTNQELVETLQDYSMRLMYRNSAKLQNQYNTYVKQLKQVILSRM